VLVYPPQLSLVLFAPIHREIARLRQLIT